MVSVSLAARKSKLWSAAPNVVVIDPETGSAFSVEKTAQDSNLHSQRGLERAERRTLPGGAAPSPEIPRGSPEQSGHQERLPERAVDEVKVEHRRLDRTVEPHGAPQQFPERLHGRVSLG